jgi:hypothetical protein
MNKPQDDDPTRLLLRDVMRFQVKLWLEAARDVVLSPITLAAAALDFVLIRQQTPRYFRELLKLGRRSEDWIDLWSMVDKGAKGENVDAVLAQIERVVRDPRVGARRARRLMRWAEVQLVRQREALKAPIPATSAVDAPLPPAPPPPPPATARAIAEPGKTDDGG